MFLAALLTMSQLALPLFPAFGEDAKARWSRCVELAIGDAQAGEQEAQSWAREGGGYFARHCLGVALANQNRFAEAAGAFQDAAREAEAAKDSHQSDFWAQAGNAWLAAGDPAKARVALDAALASGGLSGDALGEAYLDRARARVAEGDYSGARSDLDRAVVAAPTDPLAWLLSATLARRMVDRARADADIREALRLAPEDASVQLEAGNIAAMRRDEVGARAAWTRVIELAPGTPLAESARNALEQFGAER